MKKMSSEKDKWLPLADEIDESVQYYSNLDSSLMELVSRKEYEVLEKKIKRVNDYLDDVLKYNASARLEAVVCVVKDILNGEDKK